MPPQIRVDAEAGHQAFDADLQYRIGYKMTLDVHYNQCHKSGSLTISRYQGRLFHQNQDVATGAKFVGHGIALPVVRTIELAPPIGIMDVPVHYWYGNAFGGDRTQPSGPNTGQPALVRSDQTRTNSLQFLSVVMSDFFHTVFDQLRSASTDDTHVWSE